MGNDLWSKLYIHSIETTKKIIIKILSTEKFYNKNDFGYIAAHVLLIPNTRI